MLVNIMSSHLFCLGLSVESIDSSIKDFLKQLRKDLGVVYDELHSEDEHDWMLFFTCDDELLERIKSAEKNYLPKAKYCKYYLLASPNSQSVKRKGDETVILDPKYGLQARIDF